MAQAAKLVDARFSRKNGHEVIAYIGCITADRLQKHGLPANDAAEIAFSVMDDLGKEMGGQNVYFPNGYVEKAKEKAGEVFDKFYLGASISELVHEYSFSTQYVYKLIANERARRKAERDAASNKGI